MEDRNMMNRTQTSFKSVRGERFSSRRIGDTKSSTDSKTRILTASDIFLPSPAILPQKDHPLRSHDPSNDLWAEPEHRQRPEEKINRSARPTRKDRDRLVSGSRTTPAAEITKTTDAPEVKRRGRPRRNPIQKPAALKFKARVSQDQMEDKIRILPTEYKVRFLPTLDHLKQHGAITLEDMKRFHGKWAKRNLDRLIELQLIVPEE